MYIDNVIYNTHFSNKLTKSVMSDRVKVYFNDLYKRYNCELNMNFSDPVYDYDQMALLLFDAIQIKNNLEKTNIILFPVWGNSWSMNYASSELYWKSKFKFQGMLQDIRDCGSLCAYHAFSLLLKLHETKSIQEVLCCSIENAYIFTKNKNKIYAPEIDYIGSITCKNDCVDDCRLKILSCVVVNTKKMNASTLFFEKLREFIIYFNIEQDQYFIYCRKNTVMSKDNILLINIECNNTSGFLYYCIDLIFKKKKSIKFEYIFIVDFDISNNSMGIFLLKIEFEDFYE